MHPEELSNEMVASTENVIADAPVPTPEEPTEVVTLRKALNDLEAVAEDLGTVGWDVGVMAVYGIRLVIKWIEKHI